MQNAADTRSGVRAFLAAAATDNARAVHEYLEAQGDSNATLGDGWTALHHAVRRGHKRVIERLVRDKRLDMNGVTLMGTSALTIALRHRNNVAIRLLLDHGASRATVDTELLREAWDAEWIWPDVQQRLHPHWSIVWSPSTRHRFSKQDQLICRLVLSVNAVATLRKHHATPPPLPISTHSDACQFESNHQSIWKTLDQWIHWNRTTTIAPHRWVYLPPTALQLVLEYALFLW